MPFPRHMVEPRHTRRGLDHNKKPSLLEFNNLALANIIRQLANLSEQVNIIFGSLVDESEDFMKRLNEVKSRLENVDLKVKELDSVKEEIGRGLGKDKKTAYRSIAERNLYFQSERRLDTGLFMQKQQPVEVTTLRKNAEKMPALHELDQFRTDNKESSKIYSNPDLFFLAWQDSLQQMMAEQKERSDMKAKRTVRQTKLRRVKRAKASRIINAQKYKMGIEFVPEEGKKPEQEEDEYFTDDEEWSSSDEERDHNQMTNGGLHGHDNPTIPSTELLPPPPMTPTIPLPNIEINDDAASREYSFEDIDNIPTLDDDIMPPPPPLPYENLDINGDFPPPLIDTDYSGKSANYDIENAFNSMNVNWNNATV